MTRKIKNIKVLRGLDIRMEFGRPVMIQFAAYPDRYKSVLIGTDQAHYVIVQIPVFAGVRNRLYEGNRVTIRYVDKATVFGFHSTIKDFIFKPAPLLFLNYPETVDVVSMRGEDRVSCYLEAVLEADGRSIGGAITDLSQGGCRFSMDKKSRPDLYGIGEGRPLSLRFPLGLDGEPLVINGQVRGFNEDSSKVNLGIMFDKTEDCLLAKLSTYISNVRKFIG